MIAQKDTVTTKEKLVYSALDLSSALGWDHITLQDIGEEAGISISILVDFFDNKNDILSAYGKILDKKIIQQTSNMDGLNEREKLFDLLMDRFETLNIHRNGVISILNSLKFDPKRAVLALPHLGTSMHWMLESIGIQTNGIKGGLKIIGLTGLYLKMLKVWIDDDTPDLSKTMAALDNNLGHAENWAKKFQL